MALNNNNNNDCCKCTTPEYEIVLNEQGPQGRQGEKGDAGFSPVISVKDDTSSNYTLNILTQDGQITTPNLKANLPSGGATGQVLTKNSANQDDCSWQNLPNATTEIEGIARLATENDFETTEDSAVSDSSIVTPALFNTEFEKQSANFVTTDTQQDIDASKTFWNGLGIYNNLTIPYNSPEQNGKIVTNAILNDVRIPIVEPYDSNGSFRIGAAKGEAYEPTQNGFDINNDIATGLQGVTYYEQGQKGKLIADFNIDKYVKAGDNVTINKGSDGSLTINSTGGTGGTSDYTQLTNKPQINGHELTGNQEGNALGLANESEITELGNELNQLANDVTNLDTNKQDKLIAGRLINIDNNNISVPNVNLKNVEYNNTDETLSYIDYNDNSFNQIVTIDYAPYKDGLLTPVFNTVEPNAIKSFDFITIVKMGECKYNEDRRIIQVGNGNTNFWFDTYYAENIRYCHFINGSGSGESIGITDIQYNNNYLAFRLKSDGTKINSYYKVCTNNELPNDDDWNLVRADSWNINSYPLTSDTKYSFYIAGVYSLLDSRYITSVTQPGKYFFNNTRLIVNGEVVFDGINSINTASKDNLGLVKIDGTTITNNSNGQLQVNLPDNLTTQGNTFNGASQLVQLDSSGKLPAIDGSQLINLPNSIPDNMVTTDTDQTITGTKTFDNPVISTSGNNNITINGTSITINPSSSNGATISKDQINLRGGLNSGGLTIYSSSTMVQIGQNNTNVRLYGSNLYHYNSGSNLGEILDTGNFSTLAPTGTLKYWTGTETDYTAIATKDADTLYRTTDTNKVYLGTIQLGG